MQLKAWKQGIDQPPLIRVHRMLYRGSMLVPIRYGEAFQDPTDDLPDSPLDVHLVHVHRLQFICVVSLSVDGVCVLPCWLQACMHA